MTATRSKTLLAGALVLLATGAARGAEQPAKLRVLLLSGQNNHDFKSTTPALVKIYETSGHFAVTVVDDVAGLTPAAFAACDVVVSNWTPWPDVKKRPWDAATEKAFLDFVRGGGGMVVFHAACTACQGWPEFQQIVGATWELGKTGHGKVHVFEVKIADAAHPVTAGMKDFEITDELWHRMAAQPGVGVLCTATSAKAGGGSGEAEPVAICTQFGKGRGLNLVLGHDVRAMSSPGWRALMLRGTQWAATGKVSIDASPAPAGASEADVAAALKAIAGYTFGQSREPLAAAARLVSAAALDAAGRAKLSARLAAMLSADATVDCKRFLCEQLSLIGSDAQVNALAGLLTDAELSMAARAALERMGSPAALAAMRQALAKATGRVRLGLIGSLGERRDAEAAGAIAAALSDRDAETVAAAIDALGKIGSETAADALLAARAKLPPRLRPAVGNALLRCAGRLLADGKTDRAAAIYQEMSAPAQPRHIRVAAFPGLVACRKGSAGELVLAALRGDDAAMQLAAVRAIRAARDEALLKALIDHLPKVDASVRAMVIETLAEGGVAAALPAVTAQAASQDGDVRRAALAALGRLGDASTAGLLAKVAAESAGADQAAARAGLLRLRGEGVEAALIEQLKYPSAAVRREAVMALAGRDARPAAGALLRAAADSDGEVRAEALKAVARLADAKACPGLIELLGRAGSDADRWNIEAALAAVCRRAGGPDEAAEPVLRALAGGGAAQTGSLLRVLSRLGGPKALQAVRSAAKGPDAEVATAAIRALADWPDAAPLEDLLALAGSTDQPVAKVLALRGFAKLSAKAADRDAEALAGLYARALGLAGRADEGKALLAGLGSVHCPAAMKLALDRLDEPPLANEAGLAAVRIADALWKSHPAEVRAAMQRVAKAGVAPAVGAEAARVLLELSKPRNLALDAKASSPDGLEKDGAASGDQAAIDGDEATYWDEADGKDLYRLLVTFASPTKVTAIRIVGYQHHSYAPRDFDILCDGKAVKSVRGAQYKDNRLTVAFPETTCTAVELKITGYYGRSPAVRELEIFGPGVGR